MVAGKSPSASNCNVSSVAASDLFSSAAISASSLYHGKIS